MGNPNIFGVLISNRRYWVASPRLTLVAWWLTFAFMVIFSVVRHLIPNTERELVLLIITALRLVGNLEIPYRDVYVLYGPIGHYLLGAFIKFLSLSPLAAAKLFFLINSILSLWLLGQLLRRQHVSAANRWSAVLAQVSMGALIVWFSYLYGVTFNLILLSCLIAHQAFSDAATERERIIAVIMLSVIAVISLFNRVNFGTYLLISGAVPLGLSIVYGEVGATKRILVYALTASAAILVGLALMAAFGFLRDYVVDTAQYIYRFRDRGIVPLAAIGGKRQYILYVCILVVMSQVILGARFLWNRINLYSLYLITLSLFLFSYSLLRFDDNHYYPFLAVSFITSATILTSLVWRNHTQYRLEAFLGSLSLTVVVFLGLAHLGSFIRPALAYVTSPPALDEAGKFRWKWNGKIVQNGFVLDDVEAQVLDYLAARVGSQEDVFYGAIPGSCECTTDNCVGVKYYLIQDKLPGGKYWFFDTPISPYPEVQTEMVWILQENKVRFVVLHAEPTRRPCVIPDLPGEATVFYEFVLAHYRLVRTFEDTTRRFYIYQLSAEFEQ